MPLLAREWITRQRAHARLTALVSFASFLPTNVITDEANS
jgi:hypothetical protein